MEEGKSYLVYAYVDESSDRIVATAKIEKYLDNVPVEYKTGQEVDVLIARKSDMGYNVIVDNLHWGLVYRNEVFRPLKLGQKLKGYIKGIRKDDKIDITLQKKGYDRVDAIVEMILEKLEDNGGVLDVSDKTAPEIIYNLFECSKKDYKKAIGTLFKDKKIELTDTEIKLKS